MSNTSKLRRTVVLATVALVGSMSFKGSAFDTATHHDVTKEALEAIHTTVDGKDRGFSDKAIKQVIAANEATDSELRLNAAYLHPEWHFTDEAFKPSTTNLLTLKREILDELRKQRPDGKVAWKKLGRALHGIQDFYSHSNWVELGNTDIVTVFGTFVLQNPPRDLHACLMINGNLLAPNGGGGLTSGYYVGAIGCAELPYPGKCYHGIYSQVCPGINKDKSTFVGYDAAKDLAKKASRKFVQDMVDELQGNDKALTALFGISSIAFVLDVTGSMDVEIEQVKAQVSDLVIRIQANPEAVPSEWVLVALNDPEIGPPVVSDTADAFLTSVQALTAEGGDDCPEPSQQGVLMATRTALPHSEVFLFTDASASDSALTGQVIAEAQDTNTTLSYVISGSCSPVDAAYIRGAQETGGQVYLMPENNFTGLADLIEPQIGDDSQTIFTARGTLSGSARSFSFPVDASVSRLVVSTEYDLGLTATLFRPNGVQVQPSDPDVSIAILAATDVGSSSVGDRPVYTITAPQPGDWTVSVSGTGTYGSSNFSVIARGNSQTEFEDFQFVAREANAIDGGYFPIDGMPLAGAPATGRARVSGDLLNPVFRLVDEAGTTLQPLILNQNDPDAAADDFVGSVPLPAGPFMVVVSGTDSSGATVQRQFPTLFRAQSVEVTFDYDRATPMLAGSSREFSFHVRNAGAATASFALSASSGLGTVRDVAPSSVTLGAGASATATFYLDLPVDMTIGDLISLRMSATDTSDAALYNVASADL